VVGRPLGSYLYSLLGFLIVSSVFSLLTFSQKGQRSVALASCVLLFYLTVSFGGSFITEIREFDIDAYLDGLTLELSGDKIYAEISEDGYCEGIKKLVSGEFSLSESDLEVSVEGFDFESLSATRVKILLKNRAIYADNRAIAEYVFRTMGVYCYVEVLFN
jgi:hypothetical protein